MPKFEYHCLVHLNSLRKIARLVRLNMTNDKLLFPVVSPKSVYLQSAYRNLYFICTLYAWVQVSDQKLQKLW
jgi:hypothetical protein